MTTHSTISMLETTALTPVFVDGLAAVEVDHHGIGRLALYTEQRVAGSAEMEHVLSARLLIPREVLVSIAERMLAAAAGMPDLQPVAAAPRELN